MAAAEKGTRVLRKFQEKTYLTLQPLSEMSLLSSLVQVGIVVVLRNDTVPME